MCSYIKTGLMIAGDLLDFDEFTTYAGLQPTYTKVRRSDRGQVYPKFKWFIDKGYAECVSVDEKFQDLFAIISGHEEKINDYCMRKGLEVYGKCNIKIYDDRPLYELSSSTIQKFVALNAKFEMEIFDFEEHLCLECDDRIRDLNLVNPLDVKDEDPEPMTSEIKAGLEIAGEHLDFEDLSAFVGLQPAATYVRRPETDHIKIIPKFRWKYHTGYAECDSVDARFEKLFELITGREEKIVEYCKRDGLDVYAECIIRIHQAWPLIELSRSSLKKLSFLNANFEMDIYDFRKHVCSECFDRRNR